MAKKYVSLSKLSTFLDNLKNTFSTISHKHTMSDITDYTIDSALSSDSTNPVQNKVLNDEFDAISEAMNALDLAIDGKSNSDHNHDDEYYTETEIDSKLASKSDIDHNHDNDYDTKGAADTALASAKTYADSAASTAANTVKNDLLNGAGDAYDTLKELGELIDDNTDAIDALEIVANSKVSKSGDEMTGSLWAKTSNGYIEMGVQNDISGNLYLYAKDYELGLYSSSKAAVGNGNVFVVGLNGSTTFYGNLNGNANSATKAIQDGNSNEIASTYLPLTGGTITGGLEVQSDIHTNVVKAYSIDQNSYVTGIAYGQSGWYRVYASGFASLSGNTIVELKLGHNFAYDSDEKYHFSITVGHDGDISITQLSGKTGAHLITKIRVAYKNVSIFYIDFYVEDGYEGGVNNYCVSGVGAGRFQQPTFIAELDEGYSAYEFETVSGCKSDKGFVGSLNGNAATATKADFADKIVPLANLNDTSVYQTVGAIKEAILNLTNDWRVGSYVIIPSSAVVNWEDDSVTLYPSSTYAMISIGGSYDGVSYGQWLLSTLGSERVGYVGRTNGQWTGIHWFANSEELNTFISNIVGGITTSGTGSAYTASVSTITSLTAGVSFTMIPHTVSTSTAPTLNVNGLGAKAIRRMVSNSSTSTAVGYNASWLGANKPIRVTYNGTFWIAEITKPSAADMSGTLGVSNGGTGYTSIVDTTYTTARYRASGLFSTETNPTDNGVICWTYE